jgi:hypothetical protein
LDRRDRLRRATSEVAPRVDTKLTGSAGEHHVCSMLARYGWAASLNRSGLERSDVLASLGHEG